MKDSRPTDSALAKKLYSMCLECRACLPTTDPDRKQEQRCLVMRKLGATVARAKCDRNAAAAEATGIISARMPTTPCIYVDETNAKLYIEQRSIGRFSGDAGGNAKKCFRGHTYLLGAN